MGIRYQVVQNRRRRRSLPPVDFVQITSTKVVTGGPHHAPLVVANADRTVRPTPRPVVTHTKYTQPPKDGLPNQVVIVPPTRRPAAPAAAIVHTTFRWGLNQGKLPNPPVVVPRHAKRRRLKGIMTILPGADVQEQPDILRPIIVPGRAPLRVRTPIILHSPFDQTRQIRPIGTGPIVVHGRASLRAQSPVILHSPYDVEKQNRPFGTGPVIVVNYKRRRRLKGIMTILPADAYELVPPLAAAPQIIPFHRNPAKDFRLPLVLTPKPSISYRTTPVFTPIVVPRHVGSRPAPWVFTSQFLKFIPPPPRHDPTPRTLIVRVVRRHTSLWPRPVVTTSILQPDDQRYTKPWDLIAACIAWLRRDAEIVAKFGDAKGSETHQKFVSDVELPKTDPPYVVFSEPIEVEHYESQDPSRRFSSRVEGVFQVHVVCTEKLVARQYADMVAAALQDAPLEFTDGLLMYLRRANRQFPSFRSTGPGRNVTQYKRIIEFNYMIERFF